MPIYLYTRVVSILYLSFGGATLFQLFWKAMQAVYTCNQSGVFLASRGSEGIAVFLSC